MDTTRVPCARPDAHSRNAISLFQKMWQGPLCVNAACTGRALMGMEWLICEIGGWRGGINGGGRTFRSSTFQSPTEIFSPPGRDTPGVCLVSCPGHAPCMMAAAPPAARRLPPEVAVELLTAHVPGQLLRVSLVSLDSSPYVIYREREASGSVTRRHTRCAGAAVNALSTSRRRRARPADTLPRRSGSSTGPSRPSGGRRPELDA